MLLKDFVTDAKKTLGQLYPPEESAAITGILCEEFLQVKPYTYIIEPCLDLDSERLRDAEAALRRLCAGEPIQYILGAAEFYGRRFRVAPGVLIPRPETEILCQRAIEDARKMHRQVRILDLCTGSGCIAWTMALEAPGSWVTGVDISDKALEIAAGQVFGTEEAKGHTHKSTGILPPRFIKADILDTEALEKALDGDGPFDLILSNPPYVLESERALMRRNVLEHEPSLALFVSDGDPMAFNRKIAKFAKKNLHTDGVGYVEINEALGSASEDIFRSGGFRRCSIVNDLQGKPRFIRFSF